MRRNVSFSGHIAISMWQVTVCLFTILCVSCVSGFAKFYQSSPADQLADVEFSTTKPEVVTGSDIEADSYRMMEDGYALIGYSSFNGPAIRPNSVINQAKKVGAQAVIITTKYTNSVVGASPVTSPTTQYVYTPSGTATISGSTTSYIPYSVARYDQTATFWSKQKHVLFGAHVASPSGDEQKKAQTNKGVIVRAIMKNSPAYEADILKGDTLLRVGDKDTNDPYVFKTTIALYRGKQAPIVLSRDGSIKTVMVKIPE